MRIIGQATLVYLTLSHIYYFIYFYDVTIPLPRLHGSVNLRAQHLLHIFYFIGHSM